LDFNHKCQIMLFLFFVLICSLLSLLGVNSKIHGGTFLAMAGKDSVVIAADSRFSSQQTGSMLISGKFRYV